MFHLTKLSVEFVLLLYMVVKFETTKTTTTEIPHNNGQEIIFISFFFSRFIKIDLYKLFYDCELFWCCCLFSGMLVHFELTPNLLRNAIGNKNVLFILSVSVTLDGWRSIQLTRSSVDRWPEVAFFYKT